MTTLREAVRQAGITDSPLSVRRLAQRSRLTPPISLRQLIGELEKGPAPVSLESVNFRQAVITPEGTALGGFVDVTLRSDGTYKAQIHMRATGLPNYDFTVRAVFAAANGLSFAWQHSGNVEGTQSTGLFEGPRRSNDKVMQGSHPAIKEFWPAVKDGRLAVSKEYSASGVIGFIGDLAKTVFETTTLVYGGAYGVILGLGDEMVQAINSLELGGDFGLIHGVVCFASGGGLVLAVVNGVEVGLMTKALIKYRPLHPSELDFAKPVFGASLPPANRIVLTNLQSLGQRAFVMPGTSNIVAYINIGGAAYDNPTTHVDKYYPFPGQLLIHELVHVWQVHHGTFVPGWVCEGLVSQVGNTFVSSYDYTREGAPRWSEFNLEQQGSIVDDWFGGTRVQNQTKSDSNDPYFGYIRDNIRPGRP